MSLGLHDCATMRTVEIFELLTHGAFIYVTDVGLDDFLLIVNLNIPCPFFTDLCIYLLKLSIHKKSMISILRLFLF